MAYADYIFQAFRGIGPHVGRFSRWARTPDSMKEGFTGHRRTTQPILSESVLAPQGSPLGGLSSDLRSELCLYRGLPNIRYQFRQSDASPRRETPIRELEHGRGLVLGTLPPIVVRLCSTSCESQAGSCRRMPLTVVRSETAGYCGVPLLPWSWVLIPRWCSRTVHQEVSERNGIVVFGVMRTVDQRDRPMARSLYDWPPCIRVSLQFGQIAATKVIPLSGVVAEPFSQLCARRHIFEPSLNL